MKIIDKLAAEAFMAGEELSQQNTIVSGGILRLHGNLIAVKHSDGIEVTTAGWNTRTTLARLNALPGISVSKKAGKLYLNGELWDGKNKLVKC